jgi:glutamine amidotransferase
MNSVTVVDSGVVNLRNITRALEHVGGHVRIDKDPANVLRADRIVLPGVGAFASGAAELRSHHLDSALKEAALAGTPILGICLGMQLLLDWSEEDGRHSGLGLIAGGVVPVPSRAVDGSRTRKVPHIGWNALCFLPHRSHRDRACLAPIRQGEYFYFVHSYMAIPKDPAVVLAQSEYGGLALNAAIAFENVIGLQFHPERSGPEGLKILEHFVRN